MITNVRINVYKPLDIRQAMSVQLSYFVQCTFVGKYRLCHWDNRSRKEVLGAETNEWLTCKKHKSAYRRIQELDVRKTEEDQRE